MIIGYEWDLFTIILRANKRYKNNVIAYRYYPIDAAMCCSCVACPLNRNDRVQVFIYTRPERLLGNTDAYTFSVHAILLYQV